MALPKSQRVCALCYVLAVSFLSVCRLFNLFFARQLALLEDQLALLLSCMRISLTPAIPKYTCTTQHKTHSIYRNSLFPSRVPPSSSRPIHSRTFPPPPNQSHQLNKPRSSMKVRESLEKSLQDMMQWYKKMVDPKVCFLLLSHSSHSCVAHTMLRYACWHLMRCVGISSDRHLSDVTCHSGQCDT